MSKKKTQETVEETVVTTTSITLDRNVQHDWVFYKEWVPHEVTQEVHDVLCQYIVQCSSWKCKTCK